MSLPAASNDLTIPPFVAKYRLKHNNIEIGLVKLTLKKLDQQQYQLTSKTETSGLLSFVRDHDVKESSLFELQQGQVRPLYYQYSEQLGASLKKTELEFNWQEMKVTNSSKGNSWRMAISSGVIDKALMQIALMSELKRANNEFSYFVADGGRLKEYSFKAQQEETVRINKKSYKTIKLARKKDAKPLITYYWCAKELHMLPVLLTRKKKYGAFRMELLKVTFEQQP